MESVDQIMDQIKKETEPASGVVYLCCPKCGVTSVLNPVNPIPYSCYTCGKPTSFGTGPTPNAAKEKAAAIAFKKESLPAADNKSTEPVAAQPSPVGPAEPAKQPARQSRKPKVEKAVEQSKPNDQQTGTQEEVKPTTETVNGPLSGAEWREMRMKAVADFIFKFHLNQVEVKPVGRANVYTHGFTQWNKTDDNRQVPSYTFADPGDDPSVYNEAKRQARLNDSRVMNDVVMLTNIDDVILPTLYNAELVASIVSKKGRVAVKTGDVVEVGARLSGSGSIIWSVIRKL